MSARRSLLVAALLVLAIFPASSLATEQHPTLDEVSHEVMCPSCGTTLDRSDSPAADRMRAYIDARIDDDWTKSQILDGLVAEYGGDESILARPRAHGLGALAWAMPAALLLVALIAGTIMTRRWRRSARTLTKMSQ